MNLLNKINKLNFKFLFLSFLIFVTIFNLIFFYFIQYSGESVEIYNEKNVVTICSENKIIKTNYNFNELSEKPYLVTYQHVDIYPETNNLNCLGKVINITSDPDNKVTLIYGINDNLYNLMNISFNSLGFLSFILLLRKNNSRFNLFGLVFTLILNNVLISSLFSQNNELARNLFNYSFWINVLSFYLLSIPFLKKDTIYLYVPLMYYILFDYDFFGIYSILILVKFLKNKEFPSSKFAERILYFLPALFFGSRIITATSEKFNLFWEFQFQKFYFGYSRYFDLQHEFLVLKCNIDKNASHSLRFLEDKTIFCLDWYGYGPIRKIIPLYGEVWSSVLLAYLIVFCIFLYQYSHLLKRYKSLVLIVTLLFISPSVNLLIHLGNPDIFYFVCLYFIILFYKKFPLAINLLLYIFTLWKIHAIGILFGLLVFSILNSDLRKAITNFFFIFLTGVTYLFDALLIEPLIIPEAADERMGYGMLHDAKHLTKYTQFENFNHIVVFYSLISLICAYVIYKLLQKYNYKQYNFGHDTYAFMFWFFLTVIYENQSYRLPLFLPLFVFLFSLKIKELNYFIIFSTFLNPVIAIDNLLIEKTTLILNRLGIYFVFCFLMGKLLIDLTEYMKNLKLMKAEKMA